MGYTTKFKGSIEIDPPLTLEEFNDINDIYEGEYHSDILGAPNSYCQWRPDKDGKSISWDGNEKFYDSVEWMQILISEIICNDKPRFLNGKIHAQGEEFDDRWVLLVTNNKVTKRDLKMDGNTICCPNCNIEFELDISTNS